MVSLTKQQLNLLENAYIKRSAKVKLSANWLAIYRALEVGELDAAQKHLCFCAKDFELLKQSVQAHMGLELGALNFELDRQAMSAMSHNEKLAKIKPEADYVLVKFLGFNLAHLPLSPLSSLRLPTTEALQLCKQHKVTAILVVENLDTFDHIHRAHLHRRLISCWWFIVAVVITHPMASGHFYANKREKCR